MSLKPLTRLALALVLALSGGALHAQSVGSDLSGTWIGRATLTNAWPDFACRYEGGDTPPAVRLELSHEGGQWTGSVALDVEPTAGSGCPALRKRYAIPAMTLAEGALSFTDSGGNDWNLSPRRGEARLVGLVAWKSGDESLANGFKAPSGVTPLTRLSGEVRLQREVAAEDPGTKAAAGAGGAPAEATAAGGPPKKITAGKRAGHVGAVIAANVVAAGALYGVNKAGKSSSDSGVVTCSPRYCIIAGPGEPCLCNANVLSGSPCGSTASGVPQQAVCNQTDLPCQSGLSCNAGVCQDRFGFCPY